MRVNGGFLAGLDIKLERGLNVIIGPRGVGKTTLLEFIRHALGVAHADPAKGALQQKAIEALLGSGEVILDLESSTEAFRIVVDAAGGGRRPDLNESALMLGQNELESIASSSTSRLNLVDLRANVPAKHADPRVHKVCELTQELSGLRTSIATLGERSRTRTSLLADRQKLIEREAQMLRTVSEQSATDRLELKGLEDELVRTLHEIDTAQGLLEEATDAERWRSGLSERLHHLASSQVGAALAQATESPLNRMLEGTRSIERDLTSFIQGVRAVTESLNQRQLSLRARAEPLRTALEAAEAGLGQLTAQLRNIERQLSQLEQIESDVHALQNRRIHLENARNSLLDELEETQEAVFEARDAVAREVSNQLGNRVIIAVEHLADAQQFKDTLTHLLHKSGLQYKSLAEGISRSLLPRQLLTLIESEDSNGLAAAAGITEDRAARAVGHLGDPSALAAIAACQLEDSVDFRLRDGSTTKSVEKLSTGQKCAATLPIVLTETTRTLILDQPEDHLDNAFLVDNIITALVGRSISGAQTIVATHNANIPVLGSADRVITLESDGLRGSASHQGAYNSPALVERITSLMEGGRAAFEHRAEFYRRFGSAG